MRAPLFALAATLVALACDTKPSDDPPVGVAKTETKAPAKSDAKVEAKTDAKTDAKTEAKTEAKVEAKTDAKTDGKVEPPPPETPKADAKPAIPTARPKTLTEARDHLIAIAANDALGELAKLAETGGRIETTHQHESRGRKKRSYLATDDPAKLAASFEGEPWKPIQYVSGITDDYRGVAELTAQLHLDEKASTVKYEPDGMFTVTFRFAKKGDELVLVGIDTYDEEP